MIKRGDRVRMTDKAAAGYNNNMHPGYMDWRDRRGWVRRVTWNKTTAMVLWDGRTSDDPVPVRALEPEPEEV